MSCPACQLTPEALAAESPSLIEHAVPIIVDGMVRYIDQGVDPLEGEISFLRSWWLQPASMPVRIWLLLLHRADELRRIGEELQAERKPKKPKKKRR